MSTQPTTQQMQDISAAHDAGDAGFAARAQTVTAAIAAGVDVKTLAAAMVTAAAVKGSGITPVGVAVLGYGKAAHEILVKTGVTPNYDDAAHVRAIAQTYRAVMRHGRAVALKDIVAAGVAGKTPAAKVTRVTAAADGMVAAAKAARKASKPRVKTQTIAAGKSTPATVIKGIAGSVAAGKTPVTPELQAAIAALVEAARIATPAATATPATIAARKTPAAA